MNQPETTAVAHWDLMWARAAMLGVPPAFVLSLLAARDGSVLAWFAGIALVWPMKCLLMMVAARVRPSLIGAKRA